MLGHFAIVLVLAGAAQAAAAPPPTSTSNRACALLTFDEVGGVQKVAVKDTKISERTMGGQRHASCVFAAEDVVHSVSVTLTTALDGSHSLTEYWTRTFTREREEERPSAAGGGPKREPPALRRVTGLGSDAVWTGDGKAGSLYVLTSGAVLRVSVGGVADVAERLRRSQELAALAVGRLERDASKTSPKLGSH